MNTHSTPSGVVTEYFESLRWLVRSAVEATDPVQVRRLAALATVMAVTAVEVFLNLWFRRRSTDTDSAALQDALTRDLDRKITIDQKLTTWPPRHLGATLDLKDGPGGAFMSLKDRRNSIVHFTSTHETVHVPLLIIHGLVNTTEYDELSASSSLEALAIAEELVMEVFRLAGFDETIQSNAASGWIGKRAPGAETDPAGSKLAPWLAPHVKR